MLRPQPGAYTYQRLALEREEDVPPEIAWQAWTQGVLPSHYDVGLGRRMTSPL